MIDVFKNWINTLLMLGIFVIILQLIIPNTNLKKYINTLIGILVIATIISPVYDIFKNGNLDEGLEVVISNIDEFTKESKLESINENYSDIQNELIISSMQEKIKENITNKFREKDIEILNAKVSISKKYEITNIDVYINKDIISSRKNEVNQIIENIKEEYEIDYSKISVVGEVI